MPTRHTFILKGTNSLLSAFNENPRHFKEQWDEFIFYNNKFERGFHNELLPESNYLPIPFPRFMNKQKVSENGHLVHIPEEIPEEAKRAGLTMEKLKIPDHFHQ